MISRISVVMVDGGFRENVHAAESFARQEVDGAEVEVFWVEYFDTVNSTVRNLAKDLCNLHVITLGRSGKYHSSYCFNAGIQASQGELVMIPDADILVEPGFLEEVKRSHEQNDKLVMYCYRWNERAEDHVEPATLEHLQRVCEMNDPENFGGCLTVRRRWLLEINGFEQHPIFESGFHANGSDIHARLKALGLHVMWHPDLKLYHPWHPMSQSYSDSYIFQHLVIKHRSKKRMYLASEGIDPTRNTSLPKEVMKQIEDERIYLEWRRRSWRIKVGNLFRKIFGGSG